MKEIKGFQIDNIDGCEFAKSSIVGKMIISHHQDFDGKYTGRILVVYPDGSHGLKSIENAQKHIDDGMWKIYR